MPFGSISTLSGASGVGKTAFLATMIKAWQDRADLFGFKTNPPPAIGVLACDRPWRDHAKWFEKAGCAPFPHFSLRDEEYNWEQLRDSKTVAATFGKLIDLLALPPTSLVIVDPISLFIPGRLFDYKDVAIGMGQIDGELKRRHLTALGIFHVGKQKANATDRYARPQDRILGSTALIGYSETAFYLLDPAECGRRNYEFGIVSHQAKPISLYYDRDPATGLFVPANFLDDVQELETALSVVPLDGAIITTSLWILEIQKVLRCSVRSSERLIRQLTRDDRVAKAGHGKFRRMVIN
jgi:hypothetical protein